jgi:signal transduction histidine kinase
LAIIKTAMCIMRTQSHEDNLSNGHLHMVEEEINRIARILRELLDFSRPSPIEQRVDVNAVIHILERCSRRISKNSRLRSVSSLIWRCPMCGPRPIT